MKKWVSIILYSLLLISFFPTTVFANSSWQWISETRPYDVLPFVIVGTLIIEIFCIYFFTKIHKIKSVFYFVILGNVISFLFPYFNALFDPIYSYGKMMDSTPFYTVGSLYLLTTLIAEVPISYLGLHKYTNNHKRLLYTIFLVNIITTILVAIVERIFCHGQW